jgi:hypothetical protein
MPEGTDVPVDVEESDETTVRSLRLAHKLANQRARQAEFERDMAHEYVKALNKQMGRQGETIHHLRGDLARTREEISKVERGQLRWLERQVQILREQHDRDDERFDRLTKERDEAIARAERAESLEIAEDGEYQDRDGSWHSFQMDRWRPVQEQSQEQSQEVSV